MESISDLAHRVLFADSLDEKLRLAPLSAGELEPEVKRTDFTNILPTRPENLRFARDSQARPSLPGRAGLVDDQNRGVLLHFFANHELLAAELMALALLRFPDAPKAFREGLARTLREEQIHTRWYVNRMQECGVEFGQYPVSRFFWEAVSQMENPLDYVSRLSLTFEQANLDYSLHFSKMLGEAGDSKSASILLRIYNDEIAHVGYGLRWFRKWKEEGESDWNALKKQLPFPLSPSRAKGNRTYFNEEGRRAAGFDDDYIRHLSLFERSKGRTPNVFYFNPDAEQRAAAWPQPYHADKTTLSLTRDLELLAAFLARKDDVLLMRRPPTNGHLIKLRQCGMILPEIEALDEREKPDPSRLILHRKVNSLRPWSIAPNLSEVFANLQSNLPSGHTNSVWTDAHRGMFSKLEQSRSLQPWMGTSYSCDSSETFNGAIAALKQLGFRSGILKRDFSSAGAGMRRIDLSDHLTLPKTGTILEPFHNRVLDFSVQYRIESGKTRLIGFVEQIISPGGGYRGSLCQVKFCKGLDPDLAAYLMGEALPLYNEDGPLAADLAAYAAKCSYDGPLGVDAYVHRGVDGKLLLRPICEVNPRYTMGRVALELKRHIAPGYGLRFEILKAHAVADADNIPLLDATGRMCGGSVILTEPQIDSLFAARMTVAKNLRPQNETTMK